MSEPRQNRVTPLGELVATPARGLVYGNRGCLHDERIEPGTRDQRHHAVPFGELPDGAFVLHDDAPHLVLDDELLAWTPAGYESRVPRPDGEARAITPPSLVELLRGGSTSLVPVLHHSAL